MLRKNYNTVRIRKEDKEQLQEDGGREEQKIAGTSEMEKQQKELMEHGDETCGTQDQKIHQKNEDIKEAETNPFISGTT